jgi:predicted ester cyclase
VEDVINRGNIDIIPELYHPDYVDHTAPPGEAHEGSVYDQVSQIPKMFRGAFPDVHFVIEDMVEEGDWVAARVTGSAQHLGRPFMGVPPAGRHAVWSSEGFFRIKDGKIIEHYGQPDLPGLREQIAVPAEPGSLDENRAIVTRYVYEVNMQNYDAFDEFVHPDFIDHNPIPGQKPGVPGLKDAYRIFSDAIPDVWFTFEDLIAEDDLVVGRGVIEGTHKGNFMGIPATGKKLHWTGTRLFRVKDGKVTEGWINFDLLGLMQQLGVVPSPPMPPPPDTPPPHLMGAPSTKEQNHKLMEEFVEELWNKGNLAWAEEHFHPDASSPNAPGLPHGAQGTNMIVQMMRSAFPDFHMEITHMVASDDRVAARFVETGTHDGEFFGIAPTGKKVEFTEIGILRVADGKIVETWYDVDMLGLMGQLGVGG